MSEDKDTYRKILKATSIFGSIQVITVITSIIKSKILAVLLGPSGFGILGMLNTSVDVIKTASGFAIEDSAVKKVADLSEENQNKISRVVIILSIITGVLGMFLICLFSVKISELVFKDTLHWLLICFLGIAIFLKQIVGGISAILRGVGKFNFLAKASLISNLLSLLIVLPFFYLYKEKFIATSIILTAIINFLVFFFFYKKSIYNKEKLLVSVAVEQGKEIIYFGVLLVLMTFLPVLSNYILQIIINRSDGLETVGTYNIALTILNTYVGFLFSAMSMEYYPRLVNMKGAEELSKTVQQQAIITILLIMPIIIGFIGFGNFVIRILFSNKFLQVLPLLKWALVGMFFKSLSFSIGYIFIAKADSKIFTKTTIIFNLLHFLMTFLGYELYGLEGVGIAIMIYYFLHLLGVYLIARKRYELDFFSPTVNRISMISIVFLFLVLTSSSLTGIYRNIIFMLLFVANLVFMYLRMDKLIVIKELIKRKKC